MSQFDESQHPRDNKGQFATKGPAPEDGSVMLAEPEQPASLPMGGGYGNVDKEDRVEAMMDDLHRDIKEIIENGQVGRYLDAMNSNGLRKWSLFNRHLALAQLAERKQPQDWDEFADMANSARMMGFKQWKAQDAQVKKGEKGIWILAPSTRTIALTDKATGKPVLDENGKEKKRTIVTGFRGVPVFDVSQCEGPGTAEPEHPSQPVAGEVPPGTLSGLRDRVRSSGYDYYEEEIPGTDPVRLTGKLGYTEPSTKRVVVDSRLDDAQKASVIAHELGHIKCGHCEPDKLAEYQHHRGEMEAEAETAAYMTLRGRGMPGSQLKSFSPGYIAVWGQGDYDKISKSMNRGMKASTEILDGDWPDAD